MMKKVFLILGAIFASYTLEAKGVEIDGIHYILAGDSAVVTCAGQDADYKNTYTGDIVIPSSVTYNEQNYRVTGIESGAFSRCSITSIVIPNSVTFIKISAFYQCTGLTSITIPSNMRKIESGAFRDCSNLKTVFWNAKHYQGTQYYSSVLETVVENIIFGDSVEVIPQALCKEMTKLTSVSIPNSVTKIGDYAFDGCTGLINISMSENVEEIGGEAFYRCTSLSSIIIPQKVTTIGALAFYGCSSLTTIVIPNKVTKIEDAAFSSCTSLQSVTIGCLVKEIGHEAFDNCTNLKSITCLAPSSPSTTYSTFNNVPKTTPIYVPTQARESYVYASNWRDFNIYENPQIVKCGTQAIWEYANDTLHVYGVGKIKDSSFGSPFSNTYKDSISHVSIEDGITYIGSSFLSGSSVQTVSFGNTLDTIGEKAFYCCRKLKSVVFPDNITKLGSTSFSNCTSLTSISFGKNITAIDEYAFSYCSKLEKIVFPDSLREIKQYAFQNCENLTSIVFNSRLEKIGYSAFYNDIRVNDMTCTSARTPSVETGAISSISSLAYLYVPKEYVRAYKLDPNWSRFDIQGFDPIIEPVKDTVVVNVTSTSAEFIWPEVAGAASYTLIIWGNAGKNERICTLQFDAGGRLEKVDFSRKLSTKSYEDTGFTFEVTGLEPNTLYPFTLTALDQVQQVLYRKEHVFSTITASVAEIGQKPHNSSSNPVIKIIRDGQLLILRDGKTYNAQGGEVK